MHFIHPKFGSPPATKNKEMLIRFEEGRKKHEKCIPQRKNALVKGEA
jgi:hypothetical protein